MTTFLRLNYSTRSRLFLNAYFLINSYQQLTKNISGFIQECFRFVQGPFQATLFILYLKKRSNNLSLINRGTCTCRVTDPDEILEHPSCPSETGLRRSHEGQGHDKLLAELEEVFGLWFLVVNEGGNRNVECL